MKFFILAALISVGSAVASAETIYISPGQTIKLNQYQKVSCVENEQPVQSGPVCRLLGAGTYKNFSWNYRIAVDGNILEAKDDLNAALQTIKSFESSGVCNTIPSGPCRLLGAGTYKNFSWNFRISIGDEVVDAKDDQGATLSEITVLREAHLCY